MRIRLSGRHIALTDHIRAYAEYRLFTSVARHVALIRVVDIVVRREPADHGVFVCAVTVDLGPSGRIKTQARRPHLTAAIDRAADRLGWLLDRRVQQVVST